jgi:hypothetical protein
MNVEKLNGTVLDILDQEGYTVEQIIGMSPKVAGEVFLVWNGLPRGYSEFFIESFANIKEASGE